MNKILIFAALFALFVTQWSCKVITPVREHKPVITIIWLKPATLDTGKMNLVSFDPNKKYMVESNLITGDFALDHLNTPWAFKIMRKKWFPVTDKGIYRGYAFTSDDLGKESIMTKKQLNAAVKSGLYDEQQLELLRRHWNERKYEIFSEFSEYPILGRFDIKSNKIIPLRDKDGNFVFDTEAFGPKDEKKGNSFFDNLGH